MHDELLVFFFWIMICKFELHSVV